MKKLKSSLIITILLYSIVGNSQAKISSYLSIGYLSHLSRTGMNSEIGVDFEVVDKIILSTSYRYSLLDKNTKNEIEVKAISLFASYILINKEFHRFMIGTGMSYGNYKRYSENVGSLEKEYKDYWYNPLKLRYNYIFDSKIKIGLDASLYGDDGDGATYLGLVVGYSFK